VRQPDPSETFTKLVFLITSLLAPFFLTAFIALIGQIWLMVNGGPPRIFLQPVGKLNLFGHASTVSLLGFVVPAVVSSLIFVLLLSSRDVLALRTLAVSACAIILIFLAILASPSYVAEMLDKTRSGAGGGPYNYLASLFELSLLSLLSYRLGVTRDTLRLSAVFYVAGFLIGVTSDLLYAKIQSGVMGGFGFFDGDFMFPLGFALSALCFSRTLQCLEKHDLNISYGRRLH